MSLRLRLTLTYSLLVAIILAVFGFVLLFTMQQNLEAEMDRRLRVRASQVQLIVWPGTASLTREDISSAELDLTPLGELDAPGLYVQILNRSGQLVATSDNLRGGALPTDPTSFQSALSGEQRFIDVRLNDGRSVRMLSVPINFEGNIVGVLEIGQSRQPLQDTMEDLRRLIIILAGAALVAAAAIGWVVAHRGLRTLSVVSDQAALIAARRDFSRRLSVPVQHDEVGVLTRTINALLTTVEDTLRRHREFVADTSHELRNPLLAIRTNIELLGRVRDDADRAECIQEASREVTHMSRLVSDLLLLAQVETGRVIERRPMTLGPLLRDVVRGAEARAERCHFRVEASTDPLVLGDEGRLTQVFTNLVENAVRHSPNGGMITLRLREEAGWVTIAVVDEGEGIAPENLPHLFERFYRVDKARSRAAGGTGLGLAIVKHLVEAHGGQVEVSSEVGSGTTFSVRLPVLPGTLPGDESALSSRDAAPVLTAPGDRRLP